MSGVKHIAPWMRRAFEKKPDAIRYIYTAENNNHAAEILAKEVGGNFTNTHYLNTVVGKMSGVVSAAEAAQDKLALLVPGSDRGHLVEEFNNIYISSAPGVNTIKTKHLFPKTDLFPFEDAKLYGHNAIHFLLGMFGKLEGCEFMSQLRGNDKLIAIGRSAFIDESGAALCKKYKEVDELFTEAGFKAYVEDLLVRMTNPFLKDAIARVTRDLPRKLSWDDRSVGAMRLVMSQT
jgi:mannitol-1-phosphate 5-dehydrogenase